MAENPLNVMRAQLEILHPFVPPPGCQTVTLSDARTGSAPRLRTECTPFHDGRALFVLFRMEDDEILADYHDRDEPLYEQDVVEVFLAPRHATHYYELEVSPLGTLFDARIDSPRGERDSMSVDRSWRCAGFWGACLRESHRNTAAILVRIPFAGLGVASPHPGDRWLANFFRIDRNSKADEFTAWRPTHRDPPDFHLPAAFGTLLFL